MGQHPTPPPAPLSAQAKKLRNLMFAALGLLVVLNLFIHPHEPHFGLDAYVGFWAVFGLVGAVALGRAAKGLAQPGRRRGAGPRRQGAGAYGAGQG